jgi:hypothetical protein
MICHELLNNQFAGVNVDFERYKMLPCAGYMDHPFTKLIVWLFSIRMFVCHFTFNRESSGRSLTLPITKKPHVYEKNTLHLPNTLRVAPWKAL